MTIRLTRFLTFAEYVAMCDEAVAKGWYRNDRRMFTPGMIWSQPFYFDPLGELAALPKGKGFREEAMFSCRENDNPPRSFLSPHYWDDWSTKRAPLAVVCPNGEVWEIDRRSSNGDGWKVTGDFPNIACAPSIVVDGYHGFLGINGAEPGCFTPDIEGRGPIGTVKPIVERPT